MNLQNATVWLIGASSGIGAGLAPALAAQGARLALSARRESDLNDVAGAAALVGFRPIVKPVDVTDLGELRQVYAELVAEWGRVDVLFYNVGISGGSEATRLDLERAVRVADVNYVGLIRATSIVLPDMIARRSGEIVGMGSIAGYAGLPGAAAYSSSKAALNTYLQSLRIELHRFGVGVTTVNPGFIDTPLTSGNRFRMPFLMTSEEAVTRIVQGLSAGKSEIHFPRRLSWPAKLITALPRPVYEALARQFIVRG